MTASSRGSMLELLSADGPDPDHAEALMLYGRLVGTWRIENRYRFPDGEWRTAAGEWRFGWTLGGRVVQDVLHCPDFHGPFPGTTVRMYDVTTGLWQITWFSPKLPSYFSQTGRPDGAGGMIQEGTDAEGRLSRWTFGDVTPASFHWQGFVATPDGGWDLFQEMHATRADLPHGGHPTG
ncbi:hypothetical protein [Streptomyces sp. NPDC051909]|uniref:hypothetical protein n=1 Tax=Streptomyces sp. NPDC051909 TaxID=3154944 RepID=UPI00343C473F